MHSLPIHLALGQYSNVMQTKCKFQIQTSEKMKSGHLSKLPTPGDSKIIACCSADSTKIAVWADLLTITAVSLDTFIHF